LFFKRLGKQKEEEEEEERRQRWAANDVFIWSFGAYSFLGGENCEGGRFLLLIIDEDVKLDFDAMATEMTTQHNTTQHAPMISWRRLCLDCHENQGKPQTSTQLYKNRQLSPRTSSLVSIELPKTQKILTQYIAPLFI
jgi:hypothetical protein